MEPFSQEHKFSKVIAECFAALGEHQFLNPIDTYPWSSRNRIIARIQVFNKYLEAEDVLHARWLQQQALQKAPKDWRSKEVGIEHLHKVMHERSNGTHRAEMDAIRNAGPTLFEYMEKDLGPHPSMTPSARRGRMHIVPS